MTSIPERPSIEDIQQAAARIESYIHRTPVMTSSAIDELSGATIFFKCENLQKIGAFKIRGAANAVFSLTEAESAKGVATHSSGNHAAALAQAARWRGIDATVVMPSNAPAIKKAAVKGYGATIVFCEPTLAAREAALARVVEETGAEVIHPYNDFRVIAGQGTAALELLNEVSSLDAVIAPVGGGGLLSGTALAANAVSSQTLVYGAEPELVDDAYQSLKYGRLMPAPTQKSIADGLLTALGDKTFPIIRDHVAGIILVSEAEIITAMRLIWERCKLVVEPSGAVPLAAVLKNADSFAGKRVGIILSGGNVDLGGLPF
ncbi:MAG: threonine dehydratase [Halieaceae bacterium]